MGKKFKDTKVGAFLKDKAPKVLNTVGDLLPSNGVFGVVKNLISSSEELSPEDKAFAMKQLEEDVAAYEIEVKDRDSARQREIKMAENKKVDFMFNLTGLIGLGVFCFIVYAIVYLQIPEQNKEIWIHLIGIAEGVVLSIFGYYFGSSIKKNVHP
jgi:ABC-type antimicrobial peptide transport system permease subunit